jgi:hypothetical protein
VGWADFTGLTPPTSAYFHGSLGGAFLNSSATLSAGQVSTLYGASSAAAYRSTLTGQSGIASVWMLDDNGTTTATAMLPTALVAPCGKVNATLAFVSGPTIGPLALSVLADGSARAAGTIAAGGTQSLTVTTARGTGWTSDYAGLHLYVPLAFGYGVAPWTATMSWAGPGQVFWS